MAARDLTPAEIAMLGAVGPDRLRDPQFAQTWYGGEYPAGRGQERPVSGWQCPGCGSCYSPYVSACWHCPGTVSATGANSPATPARHPGAGCDCCPEDS